MKRMTLAIGVCVCLAAYATAAMAQTEKPATVVKEPATGATITATNKDPAANVTIMTTTEAKPNGRNTVAGAVGTLTVDASPESIGRLEEAAQALMGRANELKAQAAMMKAQVQHLNGTMVGSFSFSGVTFQQRADELLEKWKKAPESDREGIQKELRNVLKEDFQVRLSEHQKEVEQLEAQVKQLREKLDLRKGKQDEIVDFRLQQLLREAQGLGWGTEPEMGARQNRYGAGRGSPAIIEYRGR
jgi:polyhydroxyalkanoate synthesis regulator phasin